MLIYSKKIIQFVNEIKRGAKDILSKEIRLKVAGDRFYDQTQRASYPIHIVIYNNKSMLGYFDPNFYELGFHECLMHVSKEQLHNVIRHELAHYMTFMIHGETPHPHDAKFKAFCEQMGWSEEVSKATTCLEAITSSSNVEESSIFRKIQKLMALASSSNENEAEQAMIKSQQLLLKHNIESKYIDSEEDEKIFLKRILKQKRQNAKMRSIAKILETFFVNIVFHRGKDFTHLEILGNAINVEIAEYVANFLNGELENLWDQVSMQSHLKGMVAKNSFFLGIAKGYCNKIKVLKKEYNSDTTQALMVIEKKLIDGAAIVYPRLSSTRSSGSYCKESSALGEQMGKKLNINPAINRSSSNTKELIAYKE